MDSNRQVFRVLGVALLVMAAAAAIAIGAYNAGVAHGIGQSAQIVTVPPGGGAAPPAGVPYVYMYPRPWGFHFFPVFPLFFFLIVFFILRGFLWRGPWRGGWSGSCGGWGYRYGGVPPAFDEWHRRAHGEPPAPAPTHGTGTV